MKPLSFLLVLALLLLLPYPAQADDGRTVTMKMTDVDIIDAIQKIAEVGGANVIVSPKVKGKITISFADTPWFAALESVAESTGNRVVKQDFGIFTVLPAKEARAQRDAAEKKKLEKEVAGIPPREIAVENPQMAEALLELDLLEAEAEYQAEKFGEKNEGLQQLRRQIKIRKLALERMAEAYNRVHATKRAKAEDARKKVERMLAESANRARALEAALAADKVQSFEEDEARTLQLFDVSDLQKAGHKIEGVARKAVGHDGTVTLQGGNLIVHSKPTGIERLVAKLTQLREGSAFASRLLKGRAAADIDHKPAIITKVGKGKKIVSKPITVQVPYTMRVETSKDGPTIAWIHGSSWPRPPSAEAGHDRKMQQRIDQLRQAGKLLAAAGDLDGSKRAVARASELQTNLANRRRSRHEAARGAHAGSADLRAIAALRKDVNALRSEVRELTALVRQLLDKRR